MEVSFHPAVLLTAPPLLPPRLRPGAAGQAPLGGTPAFCKHRIDRIISSLIKSVLLVRAQLLHHTSLLILVLFSLRVSVLRCPSLPTRSLLGSSAHGHGSGGGALRIPSRPRPPLLGAVGVAEVGWSLTSGQRLLLAPRWPLAQVLFQRYLGGQRSGQG